MPMIEKIVQTAKQTVNEIVLSQSARFCSPVLGTPPMPLIAPLPTFAALHLVEGGRCEC
jgi:hypothetical protein